MSHRPGDDFTDVPRSYPIRDAFELCDHCGEKYSHRFALAHQSGKCLKAKGKVLLLLDCPKCKKPGIPEGYSYCLKCDYDREN